MNAVSLLKLDSGTGLYERREYYAVNRCKDNLLMVLFSPYKSYQMSQMQMIYKTNYMYTYISLY